MLIGFTEIVRGGERGWRDREREIETWVSETLPPIHAWGGG